MVSGLRRSGALWAGQFMVEVRVPVDGITESPGEVLKVTNIVF